MDVYINFVALCVNKLNSADNGCECGYDHAECDGHTIDYEGDTSSAGSPYIGVDL
eukprot:UN14853